MLFTVFSFFDVPVAGAYHLVSWLAGGVGAAPAIVLFTFGVRLLLHPLARAAMRGEKARAAMAPQVRRLQERHRGDAERLRLEMTKLYQQSGTPMLAGCLPMLAQVPFFMVMYQLFTATTIDGQPNGLLGQALFGTPLGSYIGGSPLVFAGLFAAMAVVAWFSARAMPPETPKALRLLPYGTILAGAVLPLAAGVYLLTTTTWTVLERAFLRR